MTYRKQCPEVDCTHEEEAQDELTVDMLMAAHHADAHWSERDERRWKAASQRLDEWYE